MGLCVHRLTGRCGQLHQDIYGPMQASSAAGPQETKQDPQAAVLQEQTPASLAPQLAAEAAQRLGQQVSCREWTRQTPSVHKGGFCWELGETYTSIV